MKNNLEFNYESIISVRAEESASGKLKIQKKYDGEAVRIIDVGAFASSEITSVELPDGIICIREEAFIDCQKLTKVQMSDSVLKIGDLAFSDCDNLKEIDFSKRLFSIGEETFCNCSSLEKVYIPFVETIGFGAFEFCSNLQEVIIESGLKTIDSNAFMGCVNLESITLPSSVKEIAENAFLNNIKLMAINYKGSVSELKYNITSFNFAKDLPAKVIHCTDGDYEII